MEITEVTAANDDINVDEKDGKWLVSVIGGMEKVDSEKELIVTVFVEVAETAEVGSRELSVANVYISDDLGNKVPNIEYSYAMIEITDQRPGDMNGDDIFDYYDVSKLYATYRGKTELDELVDVDVNCDGVFDYLDVVKLYAILRGKAVFD